MIKSGSVISSPRKQDAHEDGEVTGPEISQTPPINNEWTYEQSMNEPIHHRWMNLLTIDEWTYEKLTNEPMHNRWMNLWKIDEPNYEQAIIEPMNNRWMNLWAIDEQTHEQSMNDDVLDLKFVKRRLRT